MDHDTKEGTMRHHPRCSGLFSVAIAALFVLSLAPPAKAGIATSPLGVVAPEPDPLVVHFAGVLQVTMGAQSEAFMRMSFAERVAFTKGLKGVTCMAPGCPALRNHLQRFGVGIEVADLAELRISLEELMAAGWTPEALDDSIVQTGMDYGFQQLNEVTVSEDLEACLDDCQQTYLYEAAGALVAVTSALAGCTLTGPGWPACAAAALYGYAQAIHLAGNVAEECVEACEDTYGDGSDETYCSDDGDCASDEWCDMGVILGLGQNECKEHKELSDICTRDGQCASDCCKFYVYFWQCRPASKCN